MTILTLEAHESSDHGHMIRGALFWIVFYTATAFLLYVSTLQSFDRCLGRVSRIPPRRKPLALKKGDQNALVSPQVPSRA
jgi:hypothetical protein